MRSAPSVVVLGGILTAAGTLGLIEQSRAQAGLLAQVEEVAVTTHRSQGEIRTVDGAKARLLRTDAGIFVNFETAGLTPGHAYTLMIATINNPAACQVRPCEPSDLLGRTAETRADIGYADGLMVSGDGRARFAAFQPVGDLPNAFFTNGLDDPEGAEVHLIVHDHGPFLAELGASMLNTYRGGCADESLPAAFPDTAKADGESGPNTCRLLQVAIFDGEGE